MSARAVPILLTLLAGLTAADTAGAAEGSRFVLESARIRVEPSSAASDRFAIASEINLQRGGLRSTEGARFALSGQLSGAAAPKGACLPEIFANGFEASSVPPPPDPIDRVDTPNSSIPANGTGGSITWATGRT